MEQTLNILDQYLDPRLIFQYPPANVQMPSFPLASLFPDVVIEGDTYEFSQQLNPQVTVARFHALNSETDLDSREGTQTSFARLGYVKRERSLKEDDLLMLAHPVSDVAIRQAKDSAFNDAWAMINACRLRVEALRSEVLTTGKLVIDENNYKAEYDFGVPDENRKTFNWSDTKADIFKDLMEICDEIENNGQDIRPAYMFVSTKTVNRLLSDEKIRSAMFGVNAALIPNLNTLNATFNSWGLPTLVKYNQFMNFANANNTGYERKRLMDEDTIVLIPDGPIGNTVYGTCPEEVNARLSGVTLTKSDNVVLQIIPGHDYETQTIKASTRPFVSLNLPQQLVIGSIT